MKRNLTDTLHAKASVAPCTPKQHEIDLMHVRLSPYAHQVERETIAWMETCGLLPDARSLKKVERMAVWGYAGFSHPFGSMQELTLYSKYITLWLLWDDVVVERTSDVSLVLDGMAEAFQWDASHFRDADPYIRDIRAWKSIVDGYKSLGVSNDYVERLGRKMATWIKTAASENSSIHVSHGVSPWSHLRKRLITIGVIPTAQLLDLHIGNVDKLPAACRVVVRASAIVAIVNELVSVEKDEDRVNLVTLIQKDRECGFESAYGVVIDMYQASLTKLSALIDSLPPELKGWGVLMRHMAEGFSYWHFVCPRYNRDRIICRVPNEATEAVTRYGAPETVVAVV